MILSALVANGQPVFETSDQQKMQAFLRSMEGKTVWFVLQDRRPPRTFSQNAYYWASVVQTISDFTGDDPESTHASLKDRFCPRFFDEHGKPIEKSTTRLTSKEFSTYVDRIIAFAGSEYGIAIPSPDEA